MIRATAIDLISVDDTAGVFESVVEKTRRVFASVKSVGMREYYTAQEQGLEPSLVFVLADYAEYKDEPLLEYNGVRYRVIRTYVAGQTLEITAERSRV